MQTNLPFLLKVRHLLVTLCLAEACRPCYEYFESSEKEQLPIAPSGLLAIVLSCMCALCEVGFFGWEVCVSLFIFLCMLMVETEGRR